MLHILMICFGSMHDVFRDDVCMLFLGMMCEMKCMIGMCSWFSYQRDMDFVDAKLR